MADDDALALRIVDAAQLFEKALARVDRDDVEMQAPRGRPPRLARPRLGAAGRDRRRCRSAARRSRATTSVAATAESTPPESAQMTLSLPTWRANLLDRLRRGTTPSSNPAAVRRSRRGSCRERRGRTACARPRDETARRRSSSQRSPIAATWQRSVDASARYPSGSFTTESPCDIHTRDSSGTPSKSGVSRFDDHAASPGRTRRDRA